MWCWKKIIKTFPIQLCAISTSRSALLTIWQFVVFSYTKETQKVVKSSNKNWSFISTNMSLMESNDHSCASSKTIKSFSWSKRVIHAVDCVCMFNSLSRLLGRIVLCYANGLQFEPLPWCVKLFSHNLNYYLIDWYSATHSWRNKRAGKVLNSPTVNYLSNWTMYLGFFSLNSFVVLLLKLLLGTVRFLFSFDDVWQIRHFFMLLKRCCQ